MTITPGAPVLSDPVDWKLTRFAEVAVSIYVTIKVPANTVHFWGQPDTYIGGPGDFTVKTEIPNVSDENVVVLADERQFVSCGSNCGDRRLRRFDYGWYWCETGRECRVAERFSRSARS